MGKYNNKNKQRRDKNRRPIEQRSETIQALLIYELFQHELNLVSQILQEHIEDYELEGMLDNGLKFSFNNEIGHHIIHKVRSKLHQNNLTYHLNEQELIVYKA